MGDVLLLVQNCYNINMPNEVQSSPAYAYIQGNSGPDDTCIEMVLRYSLIQSAMR